MKARYYMTIAPIALAITIIAGCSEGNAESGDSANTKEGNVDNTEHSSLHKNCMVSYIGKPEALFTEDLILKYHPQMPEDARLKEYLDRPEYAQTGYTWPSGRMIQISMGGANTMETEDNNLISLSGIREIDLYGKSSAKEAFRNQHRALSADEKAHLNKAFDEAIGDDDPAKETSEDLAGSVMTAADKLQYSDVGDIGDAAIWESSQGHLYVLVGMVEFTIIAYTNGNDQERRQLATNLAKEVLGGACP